MVAQVLIAPIITAAFTGAGLLATLGTQATKAAKLARLHHVIEKVQILKTALSQESLEPRKVPLESREKEVSGRNPQRAPGGHPGRGEESLAANHTATPMAELSDACNSPDALVIAVENEIEKMREYRYQRLATSSDMAQPQKTIERTSSNEVGVEIETPKLPDRYADESYKLFSQVKVDPPTPEEALRIRNKCIKWILPFLCVGYHLMYVDKQTLGSSAILGILEDGHLSATQYNWLSSIFYLGYLLAEWPQNLAIQRFPVALWLAINLVVWGGILLLHVPCNNFGSFFVVRFFLGLAEACIVPSFLVILSMFFTYDEQAVLMPIMWAIGNSSPITSGLLSYGGLFIETGSFSPWKWFMVITGTLTVIYGILVWIFFPGSPITAHFLTPEERAQAILRIQSNHSGIEQKHFKKYQFIEAMKDPKTWLFFLHAWSQEMANGLTNQYSLIIKSFGFTTLQTTLLGCINGVTALISLGAAAWILAKTKDCRAWLSAAAYIPPVISCIMLLTLPWSNRWGLLTAIWIRATGGIPYSVVMIWASNCSAGHTKKTAVIALYHVGYGLGNILSPQLFQPQYAPRYLVTWGVILGVACILPTGIVLYLRWYLAAENKRRDDLDRQGLIRETGVIEHVDESGERVEEVVDTRQLDLTDRENLAFRYVL
ncbi:allantoate permease [Fusarium albosuccineum]|uniref:Allantoate permease n=1 Tax=Fusarium albosuccineum TaxID=1237068 RepID=A0A8H4L2C0_9HYPO|nr:allantoate permease [Fusarium albosuccineum]